MFITIVVFSRKVYFHFEGQNPWKRKSLIPDKNEIEFSKLQLFFRGNDSNIQKIYNGKYTIVPLKSSTIDKTMVKLGWTTKHANG